jgi:predicted ferric reductase
MEDKQAIIFLSSAVGLWIFQQVLWLFQFYHRNVGLKRSTVTKTPYVSSNPETQVMKLTISTKDAPPTLPGQYVYLTLPSMSAHHASFFQAHPQMVAWEEGSHRTILVQRSTGFSNDLFNTPRLTSRVLVDGPYGHAQNYDNYDKALFMASGIGIVAHFIFIRTLLEAHTRKTARVRRLSLVWFVETLGMVIAGKSLYLLYSLV